MVAELQGLVNARLQGIVELKPGLYRLSFPKGRDLLVETGERVNLTGYRMQAPAKAFQATMVLRKHISGKILRGISQHNFDRIIMLDFGSYKLVAELFADGNLLLVNSEWLVLWVQTGRAWSSRVLRRGEVYKFPDERPDPTKFDREEFSSRMAGGKTIASSLSRHLLAGKLLVEELCHRAGVSPLAEPNAPASAALFNAWKEILAGAPDPCIQSGEVLPFAFRSLPEPQTKYATLSEAVEELYAGRIAPQTSGRLEQLERRLAQQLDSISKLEAESAALKASGDSIYENWELVEKAIAAAKSSDGKALALLRASKDGFRVTVDLP